MTKRRRTDNTMTKRRRTDNTMTKRTNNYLQSTTHKTKDRATRTPLKTPDELWCSGSVSSSCSTNGTRRVTLVTNLVMSHMRKGSQSAYDNWNISVVICDNGYQHICYTLFAFDQTTSLSYSQACFSDPLLNNNLYYVTLILISLHSAFDIN